MGTGTSDFKFLLKSEGVYPCNRDCRGCPPPGTQLCKSQEQTCARGPTRLQNACAHYRRNLPLLPETEHTVIGLRPSDAWAPCGW
jgi:hypothetical protein